MISTLADALAARGYDTLTPVQEAVSNPDLVDRDLLVSAQTGSGKTVGFGIAIAPTLLGDEINFGRPGLPQALVVAPTRELAFQVKRELEWLYERAGARVASCVGGMDMRDERRTLDRGAHIVVGTPGRLCDHIRRGSLDMSELRAMVLDEADEMLDLGFREDLEYMLDEAPDERRTLLFSATVPPAIAKLAENFQKDAWRISLVGKKEQHSDISYQAMQVAKTDVEPAIFNMLRYHDAESAIVFANTRAQVNYLNTRLANRGMSVVTLSGELSQAERSHALQAMRDGRARVCVATDVAARGIDLPNLTLVIHADLPTNTETLLHRSGRTGRAGKKGISALIVPPAVSKKAQRLLQWAKIQAEWVKPPNAEDVKARDEERLLSDPVWTEEPTEEQAAFAEKLLAQHSPEKVVAAYLRLYQSRNGAAEELMPANAKPETRERKPFGPSQWLSVSSGRKDRVEARWLLPLLCRAGDVDKTVIGAIRVQDNETFVELAAPAVEGFMGSLGPTAALEDGMTVTLLDQAPNLPDERSRGPRSGGFKSGGGHRGKPHRGGGKSEPWHSDLGDDGPKSKGGWKDKKSFDKKPYDKKPYDKKPYDKKPYDKKPYEKRDGDNDAPRGDRGDKGDFKKGGDDKGRGGAREYAARPKSDHGKPAGKYSKPAGKFGGKPDRDGDSKYAGKSHAGKPSGSYDRKPGGKPSGKPGSDKPFGGKPRSKPSAGDTSKRFTPPGKSGSAKRSYGTGDTPPRRKPS